MASSGEKGPSDISKFRAYVSGN